MALYRKDNGSSLAGMLPELVDEKGWAKQLDLHSIFPRWEELVPEELAARARPLKVEKNVLWIEVENSAWLQQFQYEKIELLEVLNRHLRFNRLTDIRMLLPKGNAAGPARDDGRGSVTFERPSRQSVADFEKLIESIHDEKCRDSLMRFWYLAQACKRK
jgi:hypothetical protein